MEVRFSPVRSRSRLLRLSPLVLIGVMLVVLFPAAPAARAVVPFTPAPCPIAAIPGLSLDCGYLTVPESRSNFTGKTIKLAVAIMRSPNPNKAADPAVFLQGGPGGATLPLAEILALTYGPTLAQRDIILMDQRGTGYSEPRLDCALFATASQRKLALAAESSELPDFIQAQVDALAQCGQQLKAAGIDLKAYNSAENAADYEDLRLALGYGPWNVIGASYGSRLALTMLRFRPETLRSVVLDSAYPYQVNFHVDVFSSYNRTLSLLAADCAAQPSCNRAYPNLLGTFDALYARLNANEAQVPVIDPNTDQIVTYLPVSGVTFSSLVFQLFYSTGVIPLMPAIIGETAKGDYTLLGLILGLLLIPQGETPPQAGQALGMLTAVQCNEDATFASRKDFVKARDKNRRAAALAFQVPFHEGFLDVCDAWGLNNPNKDENKGVRSDRPVMIISGTNDPITPPDYAKTAASTLKNSFIVSYPRGGHGPSIGSPCLANAVAAFIATPGQQPDTSCIAQETPQPFVTPPTTSSKNFKFRLKPLVRTLRLQGQ
ncbi:MAG TPA: alpha/beta fold hydrolase [Herpetosiphonaceae bacterium]